MRTRRKIQHKLNARYSVSIGKKIGQILTVVLYILNYIDRLRTKRFKFFFFLNSLLYRITIQFWKISACSGSAQIFFLRVHIDYIKSLCVETLAM
jgi:hypothetical protein